MERLQNNRKTHYLGGGGCLKVWRDPNVLFWNAYLSCKFTQGRHGMAVKVILK